MKILVIEDDALLRHHLKVRLTEMGNQVMASETAGEGRYLAENYPVDIAVVDLGLPDQDGIDLIQHLRDNDFRQPILILTARDHWKDKVAGLNAGADDYLVKPFQVEELIARLNALVRRSAGFVKPVIECEHLSLDMGAKQATMGGDELELTAFEYQILEYLMRHHQQVISKQRLLDILYQDKEGDPNTIEVMISRLRKKLSLGGLDNPIVTIRGQGYRFNLVCG
ncbi:MULTISPECIES: response regulator [Ferrimonas]|uniref:Two component transcriptional regulator, winged helix family n=1 Tax=Ferrimonas sediminum TaxID=718193 RepID=A0A1G9AKD1_9GAMM|nr:MULTISPECIES: response regulator [Ferrimonas]USD36225.1 response regulator [Ferrimonas sp. SCSIO 43195]SDK27792.1 two component transcriptional regulator, winged helix family [Ferrimonas sediminum]